MDDIFLNRASETNSIDAETAPFFLSPISLAGVMMAIIGSYIRWRCFQTLGNFFTIEVSIQKDHQLVTKGPYGVVRHPSYSGGLLVVIGALLWYLSPGSLLRESVAPVNKALGVAVMIPLISPMFVIPHRLGREDSELRKRFGIEWDRWAQEVPYRLIPGIY